jgi:hypothetical protein
MTTLRLPRTFRGLLDRRQPEFLVSALTVSSNGLRPDRTGKLPAGLVRRYPAVHSRAAFGFLIDVPDRFPRRLPREDSPLMIRLPWTLTGYGGAG